MDTTSTTLYQYYKGLRENVALFQSIANKGKSNPDIKNGLLDDNRIKIGLMGHYSTGKTTLIKRLFGGNQYVGGISSAPETACLTVHRSDSIEQLSVRFKTEFTIDETKNEAFGDFVKNNRLNDYIEQTFKNSSESKWINKCEGDANLDYKPSDIKKFLEGINDFTNITEKIQLTHKGKIADNILFWIEIYDLPGFGGKDEHEDIINKIIKQESFDVIICLLDPSQGIPKEEDIDKLNEFGNIIDSINSDVKFFWAYEKPADNDNINISEKEQEIKETVTEKLKNKFFQDAKLLNFIGDEKDSDTPKDVIIKQILPEYFIKAGNDFLDSQDEFWDKDKDKQAIQKLSLQTILDEIFHRIGRVEKQDIKKIIEDKFQIDFLTNNLVTTKTSDSTEKESSSQNEETEKKAKNDKHELTEKEQQEIMLEEMRTKIKKTCDEMIDFICPRGIPFIGKESADLNKIKDKFWEKYQKERNWQLLTLYISDYKIRSNYESITQNYISQVSKDIVDNIQKNISAIEKEMKKINI